MIALRMDDVGASSKRYEVYGRPLPLPGPLSQVGDVLFLKYVGPLRGWGPYRELTAEEWRRITEVLVEEKARLTVGVTAAWVEWSGELVPFPERFPEQARVIRIAVDKGLLEVADHGLTHCVLDGYAFRPSLLKGNRRAHREFWDWIVPERQLEHLRRAQEILQGWLERDVTTFIPPGNVFGEATVAAAGKVGLRVISCATRPRRTAGVRIVGNERVHAFHDRDLVLGGVGRLRGIIRNERVRGGEFCFVRDLANRQ